MTTTFQFLTLSWLSGAALACTSTSAPPPQPPPQPAPQPAAAAATAAAMPQGKAAGGRCSLAPTWDGNLPAADPDCLVEASIDRLLWQTFVAANWPAADATRQRGVAQTPTSKRQLGASNGAPVVWATWKQDWETMGWGMDPGALTPWHSYQAAQPPCDFVDTKDGQVQVTSGNWPELYTRHGGAVLDKINLAKANPTNPKEFPFVFSGPVIDQQRQYVRYESRFNQALYDCVRNPSCDKSDMPAATASSAGAISVKAAWRPLASESEKRAYFYRDVLVLDYQPAAGKGAVSAVCRPQTMVLIAMHVVYKHSFLSSNRAKNRWIWATFEHKQAAAPSQDASCQRDGYSYEPATLPRAPLPPPSERTPVELCRLTHIPVALVEMNNKFHASDMPLPWRNYDMTAIQWLLGGQRNPPSRVANLQIEAYAQRDSCMGCHNRTTNSTDFVWGLALTEDSHSELRQQFSTLWH